jgi:CMP-2-keto-3-deoxyoctulosonic acid synthetase
MLEGSEVLAVIPARYASTRLPGKPLALIAGKPMIQHVWERVSAVLPAVVATDDARIAEVVYSFGGRVRMTSPDCPNGTARVAEVLANWEGPRPEIVLNVQGDEPLVQAHDLETLVRLMRRPEVRIGTLVTPARAADLTSPNNCFVQRLPNRLGAMWACTDSALRFCPSWSHCSPRLVKSASGSSSCAGTSPDSLSSAPRSLPQASAWTVLRI